MMMNCTALQFSDSVIIMPRLIHLALFLVLLVCLQGCGLPRNSPPPTLLPANAHKIVKTAYSQVGKKYRAGGHSPNRGFDCSGLIWWAYKQNGIDVPRITADQAKMGRSVSRKKAQSGDIVVFKTGQGPHGLHTGLYAGNGNFIHSPRSGKKVCLERMDKTFWQKHLVSIRRICR